MFVWLKTMVKKAVTQQENYLSQEAMENFVFPNENKTKLMKMYELMSIFPILIGAAKGHFLFTLKNSHKGLYVLDCHSKGNA